MQWLVQDDDVVWWWGGDKKEPRSITIRDMIGIRLNTNLRSARMNGGVKPW